MRILFVWLAYLVFMAFLNGYKMWRKNVRRGYCSISGLEYYGGVKEGITCTIVMGLGVLFSPMFYIVHSPAILILWLYSYFFKN